MTSGAKVNIQRNKLNTMCRGAKPSVKIKLLVGVQCIPLTDKVSPLGFQVWSPSGWKWRQTPTKSLTKNYIITPFNQVPNVAPQVLYTSSVCGFQLVVHISWSVLLLHKCRVVWSRWRQLPLFSQANALNCPSTHAMNSLKRFDLPCK